MNDLHRSSDELQEITNIKALSAKLQESNEVLAKWSISIDVHIEQPCLDIKINIKKPNGHGFIKTVLKEDALYFARDPSTLIEVLADDIYEQLFKSQIKAEVSTAVSNAVRNVQLMSNKS